MWSTFSFATLAAITSVGDIFFGNVLLVLYDSPAQGCLPCWSSAISVLLDSHLLVALLLAVVTATIPDQDILIRPLISLPKQSIISQQDTCGQGCTSLTRFLWAYCALIGAALLLTFRTSAWCPSRHLYYIVLLCCQAASSFGKRESSCIARDVTSGVGFPVAAREIGFRKESTIDSPGGSCCYDGKPATQRAFLMVSCFDQCNHSHQFICDFAVMDGRHCLGGCRNALREPNALPRAVTCANTGAERPHST